LVLLFVDGVTVELPDVETPIYDVVPALIRGCLQWRRARGLLPPPGSPRGPEQEAAALWPEFLFLLWHRDLIALTASPNEPDAPRSLINFPRSERLWSRFFVRDLVPHGQLRYDPTMRRFFDVHIRPTTPIAQPQRLPAAPAAVAARETETAAEPKEAPKKPRTRKERISAKIAAIRQLWAEGRVPGNTAGYTWLHFRRDVIHRSHADEKTPGFDVRQLRKDLDAVRKGLK
jgi:hypothetical protein